MKKLCVLFAFICLPFLIACSGGGGIGSLDGAANPYGFQVLKFESAQTGLATDDIRSIIRPSLTGPMFAATAAGLYSFNPGVANPTFTRNTDPGLPAGSQSINKLVAGKDGNMFICSDSGLFKYTASTASITAVAGFAGKKVLTMAVKETNVYWVGLEDLTASTTSVAKWDNGTLTNFGAAEGITASSVSNIYVDSDIIMACGTGDTGKGGLFRFDASSNKFIKQAVNVGLANGATLFFKIDKNWYAGGPNSGIIYSTDSGNAWKESNLKAVTPVDYYKETVSYSGTIRYWFSTEKGVYLSYDMLTFALFASAKGLAGDSAKQVSASADTMLWVANDGAAGGISRLAFDGN
jgi:ligand-binding sensor domain-containing protein